MLKCQQVTHSPEASCYVSGATHWALLSELKYTQLGCCELSALYVPRNTASELS